MKTTLERTVRVTSELGLHARPAAEFAEAAARFTGDVRVRKSDREVDAKSVLLLLTLDVRFGDRIVLSADGPDAERALDVLSDMVMPP